MHKQSWISTLDSVLIQTWAIKIIFLLKRETVYLRENIYHQLQHFAVKKFIKSFLTVFVQFQHLLHSLLRLTVPLQRTHKHQHALV